MYACVCPFFLSLFPSFNHKITVTTSMEYKWKWCVCNLFNRESKSVCQNMCEIVFVNGRHKRIHVHTVVFNKGSSVYCYSTSSHTRTRTQYDFFLFSAVVSTYTYTHKHWESECHSLNSRSTHSQKNARKYRVKRYDYSLIITTHSPTHLQISCYVEWNISNIITLLWYFRTSTQLYARALVSVNTHIGTRIWLCMWLYVVFIYLFSPFPAFVGLYRIVSRPIYA